MQFETGLNIKQQQKMLLTPQLLQSINILKMNAIEVHDMVKEQLAQNPALEEYVKEYSRGIPNYMGKETDVEDDNYEKYTSLEQTLEDYLKLQFHMENKCKEDVEIGNYIIESLDENGYMTFSVEEIAQRTNSELSYVKKILEKVQSLDPPGVAATSLEECLIRQVADSDESDETKRIAEEILRYHTDDVSENRLEKIAKNIGTTSKEIQNILDFIKGLNPRPGSGFSTNEKIKFVKAEIFVYENENGELVVENDEQSIPSLMVSPYMEKLFNENTENEIKEFLSERIEAAVALIKNIEQRQKTITNVAQAIVARQKEFFYNGNKYLKPMTLKDVAEDLNIHESTVSRTVNGKYLQCKRGTFELKHFFTTKVSQGEDEDVSSAGVKARIKDIVDGEDVKKPYSDQKILEMLIKEGIEISRRTIAKYREELGILSSSKRKRY